MAGLFRAQKAAVTAAQLLDIFNLLIRGVCGGNIPVFSWANSSMKTT